MTQMAHTVMGEMSGRTGSAAMGSCRSGRPRTATTSQRMQILQDELRAMHRLTHKDDLVRVSLGICESELDYFALLNANDVELPEPKFPILTVQQIEDWRAGRVLSAVHP